MDLGLSGKRALVLASSQGLGLGVASQLCAQGAHVLISGRNERKLQAALAGMHAADSGKADYAVIDLADPEAASVLYNAAKQKLGGVDILVNNTGGPPPGTTEAPDSPLWRAQIDTMLIRIIEITNLCLADMKQARWGRILTIASSGVVQPIHNLAMSNTIRSSLVGWSKSLSNEVAAFGITANVLLPGKISTPRLKNLDENTARSTGKTIEEVSAAEQAAIPAGRYGTPEEFAAVAAFLVSEPARYVTGGMIRCDGGLIRGV